jgi:hypothetical protein
MIFKPRYYTCWASTMNVSLIAFRVAISDSQTSTDMWLKTLLLEKMLYLTQRFS